MIRFGTETPKRHYSSRLHAVRFIIMQTVCGACVPMYYSFYHKSENSYGPLKIVYSWFLNYNKVKLCCWESWSEYIYLHIEYMVTCPEDRKGYDDNESYNIFSCKSQKESEPVKFMLDYQNTVIQPV